MQPMAELACDVPAAPWSALVFQDDARRPELFELGHDMAGHLECCAATDAEYMSYTPIRGSTWGAWIA
jgi:hypothetical protein